MEDDITLDIKMIHSQGDIRHSGERDIPRNHNRFSECEGGAKVQKLLIVRRVQLGLRKARRIREPIGGDITVERQSYNSIDHPVGGWKEHSCDRLSANSRSTSRSA